MVVNGRPLKRAKKRVTADLYDLLTFPAGAGIGYDGPFRTNVRSFLSRHARLPPPSSVLSPAAAPHLLTWRVSFRIGGPKTAEEPGEEDTDRKVDDDSPSAFVVDLDVVEEDVARSRSVYCDQCRVVGESTQRSIPPSIASPPPSSSIFLPILIGSGDSPSPVGSPIPIPPPPIGQHSVDRQLARH